MHSAMLFILKPDTQRTDGMRQWQLAASWGTARFERALRWVQLPTDQDVNLTVACPAQQRFTRIVPIGLSANHTLGLACV